MPGTSPGGCFLKAFMNYAIFSFVGLVVVSVHIYLKLTKILFSNTTFSHQQMHLQQSDSTHSRKFLLTKVMRENISWIVTA